MMHEEEMQLVQDILAGSESAFTRLHDRFQAYVRRVVFRIVHPDDVDDVVQMVFLQVHQKLATFEGDSKLSTWLHRIAVNMALTHRRASLARGGGKMVSLDETREDDNGSMQPVLELSYEDNTADSNSDRLLVRKAMAELSVKDQVILECIMEGYSIEEIARRNGTTIGNTKSDMYRARVRLRKAVLALTEPDQELEEVA